MKKNFWQELKKPILALAPMANVTDAAFRRLIAKHGSSRPGGRGKPDVMWTEFVSADGLCSAGREKLLPDLWFTEKERPIVAQIFGARPETMRRAAALIKELGFDGVDINMGCPDRAVEKQGAGAALIKKPKLAQELVRAAREGADGLPVSVKTRLGYAKTAEAEEWLAALLETEPAAITLHLRTRKEMSKVPAHWELAAELARFVKSAGKGQTLFLANGDVRNVRDALDKARRCGLDGVMVGRGIFGNPWFFNRRAGEAPPEKKLKAMLEHTRLFHKLFAGRKNFDIMKKHYQAYASGFAGAKELRIKLMACRSAAEVASALKENKNLFSDA